MLFLYRVLINLIFILSPIIILIRLIKKKEHPTRFFEKIGVFKKKRIKGNLIWFHGASVGELQSIIPLLENFEKNIKIKQILITSNTLSSSKIIENLKLKKIIHQFFPIDSSLVINKFISYWNPSKAFFIDSEIWPNTILKLENKKIPIILINGRITKKTFSRWKLVKNFSNQIFSKIDFCLASSKESVKFLKNLGVKKINFLGNLKFTQPRNEKIKINKKTENFFQNKKIWCALSTHFNEEILCGMVHLSLKKKFKNLLTIIIPRHIHRCDQIKNDLEKISLKVHKSETKNRLHENTDIYLVNSYGKAKDYLKYSKHAFLGGSLIDHGGQNPLEAAKFNCNILHGPNVHNFSEIYKFLQKNRISVKVSNKNNFIKSLRALFDQKKDRQKFKVNFKSIGKNILEKSYKQINLK